MVSYKEEVGKLKRELGKTRMLYERLKVANNIKKGEIEYLKRQFKSIQIKIDKILARKDYSKKVI